MDRRAEILAQIDRCHQLSSMEKDIEAKAAIGRLLKFYEAKLARLDAEPPDRPE